MDSRHESFKEGLLNHLINVINGFVQANTDSILANELLCGKISDICERIYEYLGVNIDIEDILSKHNLLSIDVVLFPTIADPEAGKILRETDFRNLISEIRLITQINDSLSPSDDLLRKEINNALHDFTIQT
jgi:hypothetical protein